MTLFDRYFQSLPVRVVSNDEHLHLLNEAESKHIKRSSMLVMGIAALLSVGGFLTYYLPVYRFPNLFPSAFISIPGSGVTFRFVWTELLWGLLLATIEIVLLTLLNIAAVHEIAVATGFINLSNKPDKSKELLRIGLEKRITGARRYGIDPFQGLNRWALLLFNIILRLKGWLGNQLIRYFTRVLLGRYAVRAVLDFAGMPLYMAINAYSIHAVLREAKVVIMGQTIIGCLIQQLPRISLSAREKELLYDTLQYIAVCKRDFHPNHLLLTKELLTFFQIPEENNHYLPDNYLEKLRHSPATIRALCQIVILFGFILDGQFSGRERSKLRNLKRLGVVELTPTEITGYMRSFLNGKGIDHLLTPYLQILIAAEIIS